MYSRYLRSDEHTPSGPGHSSHVLLSHPGHSSLVLLPHWHVDGRGSHQGHHHLGHLLHALMNITPLAPTHLYCCPTGTLTVAGPTRVTTIWGTCCTLWVPGKAVGAVAGVAAGGRAGRGERWSEGRERRREI